VPPPTVDLVLEEAGRGKLYREKLSGIEDFSSKLVVQGEIQVSERQKRDIE